MSILKTLFAVIITLQIIIFVFSYCNNACNGHGTCLEGDRCTCSSSWTGSDCSLRTCPKNSAWIGPVSKANDVHGEAECSNKGLCDRMTGMCDCFPNYEGAACERTVCPNDCSGYGVCYTQRQLADEAGQLYTTPWDADKHVGCVCDFGRRGLDCSLVECPSGPDVMKGPGAAQGRDCSGRGVCDYSTGRCNCYANFFGTMCQHQTALI